jgi:bifunctional N-acetylglucosamine-1-phosphate-uridyltransferase/glucosamine-1-phosphate-acetyltransferase GlmU-like protein
MPRNYDEMREAQDRSFTIGGETFTVRRCGLGTMGELVEMEKEFLAEDEVTYMDIADFAQKRLRILIDDQNGAVSRWEALIASEENPVEYGEIVDASKWAVELVTGLPTLPPSPSAPGPGKTSGSSKAA